MQPQPVANVGALFSAEPHRSSNPASSNAYFEETWQLSGDGGHTQAELRLRIFHFGDLGGLVASCQLVGINPRRLHGKKNDHDPGHYAWYVKEAAALILRHMEDSGVSPSQWHGMTVDIVDADYSRWAHREVRQPDEGHASDALQKAVDHCLEGIASPRVIVSPEDDDPGLSRLLVHAAMAIDALYKERIDTMRQLYEAGGVAPVHAPGLPKGRTFSRNLSMGGDELHKAGDRELGKVAGKVGGFNRRGSTSIVLAHLDRRQAEHGDVDAHSAEVITKAVTGKGLGRANGHRYHADNEILPYARRQLLDSIQSSLRCFSDASKLASRTSRLRWQRHWRRLAYEMADEMGYAPVTAARVETQPAVEV